MKRRNELLERMGYSLESGPTIGRGLWAYTRDFYPEETHGTLRCEGGFCITVTSQVTWQDRGLGIGTRRWFVDGERVSVNYVRRLIESGEYRPTVAA